MSRSDQVIAAIGNIIAGVIIGAIPAGIMSYFFDPPGWAVFAVWSITCDIAITRQRLQP